MFTLLPLLGKRLEDLTPDDLDKVKKAFKINVDLTDELREAGLALLRDDSIDKVADLIQKPESIQKLLSFFKAQEPKTAHAAAVLRCPHCSLYFIE